MAIQDTNTEMAIALAAVKTQAGLVTEHKARLDAKVKALKAIDGYTGTASAEEKTELDSYEIKELK